MIDLIKSIVDSIALYIQFAWHTLMSLVTFMLKIPTYIVFFIDSFTILPTVIVPFAIASIYIYVLYFVLARE